MAYRKLVEGDFVRVVGGGPYHGQNGVVEDFDSFGIMAGVRLDRDYYRGSIYGGFNQKNLILLNNPANILRDWEARQSDVDEEGFEEDEPCGSCSCCRYHNTHS